MNKILAPHEQTESPLHSSQKSHISDRNPLVKSDDYDITQYADLAKAAELALEISEGKYDRQYTLSGESKLGLTELLKSNIIPKPGNSALREIVNHFRFVRKGKHVELTHADKSIFSVELTQEQIKSPELIFSLTPPNSLEGNIWFSILTPDEAGMNGKVHLISCEDFFKNFTFFNISFETRRDTELLNSFGVSIDTDEKEKILEILNQSSGFFKSFKNVKFSAKKYSGENLENLEFYFKENSLFLGSTKILTLISGQSLSKITFRRNTQNQTEIDICVHYNDRRYHEKPFTQVKTYSKQEFIDLVENTQKIKA